MQKSRLFAGFWRGYDNNILKPTLDWRISKNVGFTGSYSIWFIVYHDNWIHAVGFVSKFRDVKS
jgi:hypothetical protein